MSENKTPLEEAYERGKEQGEHSGRFEILEEVCEKLITLHQYFNALRKNYERFLKPIN